MKLLLCFIFLMFVGLLETYDLTREEENFYNNMVIYKGKHDIVNLIIAINTLNKTLHEPDGPPVFTPIIPLFFVEADITNDGKRIDQGLYLFEKNSTEKMLDHGRDVAVTPYSKYAFFGAKYGIYIYKDGKTEKYGTVTNSIIQIAKENFADVLYILTEEHELYKVFDKGNKKERINVGNPQEFALDQRNNIYFYSSDKEVKVKTHEGISTIQGLPSNSSSIKLIKQIFEIEEGAIVIVDRYTYFIFANGSSATGPVVFNPKYMPTAIGTELVGSISYFGYSKKIYQFTLAHSLYNYVLGKEKYFTFDNGTYYLLPNQ